MSNEQFHSRSEYFSGTIPQGWFSSSDTSVAQSLEAWLLSDDLMSAIIIRELHLDELSKQQVQKEGLEFLATLSKSFSETDSSTSYQHQIEFKLGQTEFFSYESVSDSIITRTAVFAVNNRFFECEAMPLYKSFRCVLPLSLFSVQQSVLSSLKFNIQSRLP
jgi:hypothetical protein